MSDAYLVTAAFLEINNNAGVNTEKVREMLIQKSHEKVKRTWDSDGYKKYSDDLESYMRALLENPSQKPEILASLMLAQSLFANKEGDDPKNSKDLQIVLAQGFAKSFLSMREKTKRLAERR